MNNNDDNDNHGDSRKHHYPPIITTTPCNYDKQQQYNIIYVNIARYDCGNICNKNKTKSGFETKQGERFNRQIILNAQAKLNLC